MYLVFIYTYTYTETQISKRKLEFHFQDAKKSITIVYHAGIKCKILKPNKHLTALLLSNKKRKIERPKRKDNDEIGKNGSDA